MISTPEELVAARLAGGAFVNAPDGLGLRTAPSMEPAIPILALMPDEAAFKLTGEHRIGFVEGAFNGQTGWAYSEFLAVPGVTPDDSVATVMAIEGLNLREGPSLKADVMTLMPNGATLDLTGESRLGFLQGVFNEQAGWAFGEFLDPTASHIPTGDLKFAWAMREAGMRISQGPYQSFSHPDCDCYDFGCPVGTEIYPIAAGEVITSHATSETYKPNLVIVRTAKYGDFKYAHLSRRDVDVGDQVDTDTLLGLSGTAGTGPHLHLGLVGGRTHSPVGLSLTQTLAKVGFRLSDFPKLSGVHIPD